MFNKGDKPLQAGDKDSRETEQSLADSELGILKEASPCQKKKWETLIIIYSTETFGDSS